ncbi:MAG: hypothetical protein ACOYLF_02030 [Blastocatellia bacterium]|jgi:ElaB/YqjD/DUF883 family membrane-anchored ribosome-binding protein
MLEMTAEAEKEQGVTGRVRAVEERFAEIGAEAGRLRRKVANAVEDKYDEARRVIRRGQYAAEDLVDEASHRIKRDPLSSVAITFGVGLGVGLLIGALVRRDRE